MMHKIKSVKPKGNLIIAATFFDGTVKEYDVFWNDDLDLEAETIWEDGIIVL